MKCYKNGIKKTKKSLSLPLNFVFMKIIILGTAYPYRGGLAAFNERLAREFQNQGHEVEIYTFTHQYPDFLFRGKPSTAPNPRRKT